MNLTTAIFTCLSISLVGCRKDINFIVPAGEYQLTKIIDVQAYDQIQIHVSNISLTATALICQVHTLNQNLTLSLTKKPEISKTIFGSHIGVETVLETGQVGVTWYLSSSVNSSVRAQLLIYVIEEGEPLPGGCNLEFDLEVDPNIHLSDTPDITTIIFQKASVGVLRNQKADCEVPQNLKRLDYELYAYFLPSNDFSEASLFSGLSNMLDVKSIKTNAKKVADFYYADKTFKKFPSFSGQGIIYSIIVRETYANYVTQAAYVPLVTYDCDIQESCKDLNNAGVIIPVTILGIVGIFLCFMGHRFFKTELFIFGFLAFSVIFYFAFAITLETSLAVKLVLSGVMGIVGGVLWFVFWYFCGLPLLSVLLVGLVAGYIFTCTLFFTPFGGLSYWNTALNYGLTMACGTLVFPVIFLVFTKFLNILSCALVGSYCLVFALDTYLHGHIRYIFINSVRHVVVSGFYETAYLVPFDTTDIILCVVWGCLVIGGMIFQFYREKGKAPFPPCPYSQRKWKRLSSTVEHTDTNSEERQHLIQNDGDQHRHYGAETQAEQRSMPT